MRNALSVDVEDWFQVGAFETVIARDAWETLPAPRRAQHRRACSPCSTRPGSRRPSSPSAGSPRAIRALIRRIAEAGHEIASHGWDHQRVFTMRRGRVPRRSRRAPATRSRMPAASRSTGYRAPSFSIDARTPWAHRVLAEQGYAYSSSVAPIRHDHYGWPRSAALRLAPGRRRGADRAAGHHRRARRPAPRGRAAAASSGCCPMRFSSWAIGRVNRARAAAGHLLFPPLGDRSRPAARRRTRRSSRGCAITPISR